MSCLDTSWESKAQKQSPSATPEQAQCSEHSDPAAVPAVGPILAPSQPPIADPFFQQQQAQLQNTKGTGWAGRGYKYLSS